MDRNQKQVLAKIIRQASLSARRAWIEILPSRRCAEIVKVALRKESVDRNFDAMQVVIVIMKSLSARRAWIEICRLLAP